jgi:hypothetical protein
MHCEEVHTADGSGVIKVCVWSDPSKKTGSSITGKQVQVQEGGYKTELVIIDLSDGEVCVESTVDDSKFRELLETIDYYDEFKNPDFNKFLECMRSFLIIE